MTIQTRLSARSQYITLKELLKNELLIPPQPIFLTPDPHSATPAHTAWIQAEMKRAHLPGLVYGVYKAGKLREFGAYGYADLAKKTQVTRGTVFEIGSITKQFTAAAILLLQEKGALRIDDPVGEYLEGTPRSWRGITLRMLMNHTSGVANVNGVGVFLDSKPNVIRRVAALPLDTQPGERWAYSNTGYVLLGYVVEKASGEDYWTYLRRHIFTPLHMTHTRNSDPSFRPPNRAFGYRWDGKHWIRAKDILPNEAFSAGSLLSTLDDLELWDIALTNGKLLSSSSTKEMTSFARLNSGAAASTNASAGYGLGLFVKTANGHRIWRHSGGTGGFSSQNTILPDDETTAIVLTNLGAWDDRQYVGEQLLDPKPPKSPP